MNKEYRFWAFESWHWKHDGWLGLIPLVGSEEFGHTSAFEMWVVNFIQCMTIGY